MKKFVIGAVVGIGALVAVATPAAASGWTYTGYWYSTKAACEKAWSDGHGGGASLPHDCRYNAGGNVYELWAYSL